MSTTRRSEGSELMDTDTKVAVEMPSLSAYLSSARRLVFRSTSPSTISTRATAQDGSGNERLTLILGNPSADLDSFVSAVVLSYFYNLRSNSWGSKTNNSSSSTPSSSARTKYVPILNLPNVRSHDLWRLRPEFGVAIRSAIGESVPGIQDEQEKGSGKNKVKQLEDLITIADIQNDPESTLYPLFTETRTSGEPQPQPQPLILVDHNAPSIPGMSDETILSKFTVVGCIDHHVDEGYVPKDASPRIITTGIGSCTSLVVKHLREQGLWSAPLDPNGDPSSLKTQETCAAGSSLEQISRLALAPILIDTSNLKGKGDKCSDTDREAVAFLESFLKPTSTAAYQTQNETSVHTNPDTQGQQIPSKASISWDRDAFHHAIATAKADSLNLLTMQETFDRDYKVWREPISNSTSAESSSPTKYVNIGVSSLVKPLSWLVKHAGGVDSFLNEIETFATTSSDDRDLGVFAMLTRAGDAKELVVLAFDQDLKGLTRHFEDMAGDLQLRDWNDDRELINALDQRFAGKQGEYKIWWLGDTSKSRKQVGPLLREAVRTV